MNTTARQRWKEIGLAFALASVVTAVGAFANARGEPVMTNDGRYIDVGGKSLKSKPYARKRGSKRARSTSAYDANGNPGNVRSQAGARANVSPSYAAKFQAYINDLEQNYGARILFMGGYRAGKCGLANQHSCGGAIDVCQLSWGKVDARCKLPGRQALARIARVHGLWEGSEWCRPDTGHVQVRFSGACGKGWPRTLSARAAQ